MQGRERLAQLVPGDLVVVDVEALEHGLVEQSALLVVAAPVQLLRILQEGQAGLDESGVGVQVVLGLVESSGEVLTSLGDLAELLFDLGLGQCAVGVIAKVHGIATAAGCQLVAACDLAVAAEVTRFATPGVKIGLFCSTPMVPLSRAVGRKRALEVL